MCLQNVAKTRNGGGNPPPSVGLPPLFSNPFFRRLLSFCRYASPVKLPMPKKFQQLLLRLESRHSSGVYFFDATGEPVLRRLHSELHYIRALHDEIRITPTLGIGVKYTV